MRKYFLLFFIFTGCAALRNYELQPFYNDLNANVGNMSYDDALGRWGTPAAKTDGDETFLVTWGATSSGAVGVPIGNMVVVQNVGHGWRLDMGFDKKTRLMKRWNYNEW
jgi:hypothetical protein